MDAQRLRDNLARVMMHGDEVPLFFFSDLFLRHPEVRELFPVGMDVTRDRLVAALARIVSEADNLDSLVPFLQGLGRDHRKFGAVAAHFGAVGTSLIAALRHFTGPDWSADLEAEWKGAFGVVAKVMIDAAAEDQHAHPPWWDATVVSHELRTFDIAVIRLAVSEPLPYRPGQTVSVECQKAPRYWRFYSVANAPREDGTLDLHVSMLDGGMVSPVLARGISVGARLRLGSAVGVFGLTEQPQRDILMVAGGTGLAPLKAIVEQLADLRDPPRVHLFFGARRAEGLYDLPDLEKMAARWPWLTVTPACSGDPDFEGESGSIADVVTRSGNWSRHDAYVAGPTGMAGTTADRLISVGVPGDRLHIEDFGWGDIT
ncbi:MAG: globin domain-containing protein [Streptosporangiaceae bacterium]